MLQNNYDRQYACKQIDKEVDKIKQDYPWGWSRQDQLLVDSAEVQILVGNDKAALDLLDKCFGGGNLVVEWENAAEATKYNYYKEEY